MKKTIAVFLILIGLVLLSFAGIFMWSAYVYSTPSSIVVSASNKLPAISQIISPVIDVIKDISRKSVWQETLMIREHGYLVPFGAIGAILFIIGLVTMRLSKVNFEGHKNENIGIQKSNVVSLQSVRIAEDEDGETHSSIKIDEKLLDVEEDKLADYADINRLIALSHSDLDKEQCLLTLKILRPRLLDYKEIMTKEALTAISKQVLNNAVIRHKRQEKAITPDQFRRQNEHMLSIEQETICRRYMPRKENLDKIPQEYIDKIGHVFVVSEQSGIQQGLLSDSTEWRDISLSNSIAVMSESVEKITSPPLKRSPL